MTPRDRAELDFLSKLKTRLNKVRADLLELGYDEKSPLGGALTEVHVMINKRETTIQNGGRF